MISHQKVYYTLLFSPKKHLILRLTLNDTVLVKCMIPQKIGDKNIVCHAVENKFRCCLLIKPYLAKLQTKQAGMSDEAMHSTDRKNKQTHSQTATKTGQIWCNSGTGCFYESVIGKRTIPGARGGKASVTPAPAAASSSSSSSRFSSSPGARIFLTKNTKFKHLNRLEYKCQKEQ